MHAVIGLISMMFVASADGIAVGDLRGWTIVVASDAIPSERYAAEQFQSLLEQAAGVKLAIAAEAPKPLQNITIGCGKAMTASPVGFGVDDLGEEGVRIRIAKDNIAIAGGRPRGTLYAVYEFLERYLGVRFLTFDHTAIPPGAKTARLPCETHTHTSPFSFRWSYYRENAEQPAFAAKLRVNTVTRDASLGGVTRQSLINHSLYRQLPVSKYGKTHPEYFALWHGKRDLTVGGGGPELCVTHPDVAGIVAQSVIDELDKDPGRLNVSVSQNDNDAYCHCDRCEAINKAEVTPMGSHLAFVNAVAERVEKKHPKVKIGTLAYWYTRRCPKTIKPRDNVQIQLCSIECCTLHAIDDPNCARNRTFCRDMRNWRGVCKDIWVWNYNTNFRMYDLPLPNLRSIGANVRFFRDSNVKGLFMQANGNGRSGEFSDLRNYVISRCMWNPELDSWALAGEFCRLHYGKAARPIMEHLTLIHDNAERKGCHPGCFPGPEQVGLTPEICQKSLGLFGEALALADDDVIRSRVEKASICAYRAMIEVCGQLKYVDGRVRLSFPGERDGLVNHYAELCKRHGMTMASEQTPIGKYLERIQRIAEGYPACRLENEIWRVTVLPEDNAKIVEMIHKPTGRSLFAGMRSTGTGPGTHEEWWEHEDIHDKATAFAAKQDGQRLTLTRQLPEGSTMVRQIRLDAADPNRVFFETTITHHGDKPKTYGIKVHPEFDAGTKSDKSEVMTAYVKRDRWMKFNDEWDKHQGPKADLLKDAKGGGLAFFNHEARFGMLVSYDPGQYAEPRLWWHPERAQVNLELMTPSVELKQGEALKYAYQFSYLSEAPK
ncbi:MAG: DUF4838 domain-containing protein [Phycisphaerae bacterium]|nr:DUF4838 domain-containing protein [Phycisphaerae bacterium]